MQTNRSNRSRRPPESRSRRPPESRSRTRTVLFDLALDARSERAWQRRQKNNPDFVIAFSDTVRVLLRRALKSNDHQLLIWGRHGPGDGEPAIRRTMNWELELDAQLESLHALMREEHPDLEISFSDIVRTLLNSALAVEEAQGEFPFTAEQQTTTS